MQRKRRDRCLFVILAGTLVATGAHAVPNCHSLSAATVSFGNYDVYSSPSPKLSIPGTISYNCPPPTVAAVMIDAGLHSAAGQRGMQITTGGSDVLAYDIFHDTTCLNRWDPTLVTPVTNGVGSLTFYACIAGGQDVAVGPYSDTITVTFLF